MVADSTATSGESMTHLNTAISSLLASGPESLNPVSIVVCLRFTLYTMVGPLGVEPSTNGL